jgi:2-hydroxychromene-2-carboxylate isomerase
MADTIEFFFDIASPYSYLASSRIDWLENETGADVDWRPFFLGGVFKATGNEPPARVENKAKYMRKDLRRWAERYGVGFQYPSTFPVNSLAAQRAILAAKKKELNAIELAERLFKDYWIRDRDISDKSVIEGALKEVARPSKELLKQINAPDIKQALKRNSDEAVERGAFGAPTFFVGDEMFWGNDRLHFVREEAS